MKVPPAGLAVAGETCWPLQSTAPLIAAAAPLEMGAKKGSVVIACAQAVTKSRARKWRSGRWGLGAVAHLLRIASTGSSGSGLECAVEEISYFVHQPPGCR